MAEYTYKQYLETWEDHFDDNEFGEFTYWHYGREMKKTLPKMSELEFTVALARVDTLAPQIDELQKRPDYGKNPELDDRVDALLAESFHCELPLFF